MGLKRYRADCRTEAPLEDTLVGDTSDLLGNRYLSGFFPCYLWKGMVPFPHNTVLCLYPTAESRAYMHTYIALVGKYFTSFNHLPQLE